MENKRIDNLDLMKAIGILMVITLHVPLWKPDFITEYDYSHILQYMFRIVSEGVPIFVTINGFLLLRKKELDIKKHIHKMLKLLGILLLWGCILAFVGMLLDSNRNGFTVNDIILAVLNIQVGADYTGVLWFLQNLLAVYLIFPILWYIYNNKYDIYKYLFIIVSSFVLGIATLVLIRDLVSTKCDATLLAMIIDFINRFNPIGNGWYLFYFMLGGIMWHYLEWIKRYRKILSVVGFVSCPMAFGVGFYLSKCNEVTYNPAFNYGSVFMVLFLVGFFAFSMPYKCTSVIDKLINSIGQNTFGMYLSHFLFIFIINRNCMLVGMKSRLIAYCAVCIASYLFSVIIRKIPILKCIIQI